MRTLAWVLVLVFSDSGAIVAPSAITIPMATQAGCAAELERARTRWRRYVTGLCVEVK